MFRFILACCFWIGFTNGIGRNTSSQSFTIKTYWNGTALPDSDFVNITLERTANLNDVELRIDSPFYDNPAPDGVPGDAFFMLWNYEVVEVFFLNDNVEYLEVEIGPHGHHLLLLLKGVRITLRHSLPLDVKTNIKGNRWTGVATIPGDYLPPQVTKMNAFAIHKRNEESQYLSLYPVDSTVPAPDFHQLKFFQPIDMSVISPTNSASTEYSPVWKEALQKA